MQRAPSLLRKVYSGFNVGRILAGSLQPKLLRLAHPLPKESSPERQEPTLRMAERFHVKPCHLLSAAPYAIRNRTDATAIIRRHSPRGGVLRRAAYEPTCSRPEHRPCVACRRPSQVCWFRKAPSHVSRETKAHPFHTRLDGRSASYVLVDIEVGPRHIQPRPHRRTHLRRGLLLIEGRTWCQRADDTREILVPCELDSDTPLLRSTCHLDARIEGVGKTRRKRRERRTAGPQHLRLIRSRVRFLVKSNELFRCPN